MSKVQQLQVGDVVRVGEVLSIVRAKLEGAFTFVPTVVLLAEVGGERLFKVIEGLAVVEIDQAEAQDILDAIAARAWQQAGDAITRAKVSSCAHHAQ